MMDLRIHLLALTSCLSHFNFTSLSPSLLPSSPPPSLSLQNDVLFRLCYLWKRQVNMSRECFAKIYGCFHDNQRWFKRKAISMRCNGGGNLIKQTHHILFASNKRDFWARGNSHRFCSSQVESVLRQGLTVLTWSSLMLESFFKEVESVLDMFNQLLKKVKPIIS